VLRPEKIDSVHHLRAVGVPVLRPARTDFVRHAAEMALSPAIATR